MPARFWAKRKEHESLESRLSTIESYFEGADIPAEVANRFETFMKTDLTKKLETLERRQHRLDVAMSARKEEIANMQQSFQALDYDMANVPAEVAKRWDDFIETSDLLKRVEKLKSILNRLGDAVVFRKEEIVAAQEILSRALNSSGSDGPEESQESEKGDGRST